MKKSISKIPFFLKKILCCLVPAKNYRKRLRKRLLHNSCNTTDDDFIWFPYTDQHERFSAWVDKYDTLTDEDFHNMEIISSSWSFLPRISVLLPVYNTNLSYLTEAVLSVQKQVYTHWELCISDDCSTNEEVRNLIIRLAEKDNRIKYVFREINGHISENTNSALTLATGEFVALMDHDDTLAQHALWHVVRILQTEPDADIIYSDEDKIDSQGHRMEPCFKQDWNEELILHWNYISHLGVYRSELARKVGGFRKGFEGSQDHDFTLRCALLTSPSKIVHIPWILYHWRNYQGSGSVSDSHLEKCEEARYKAVKNYLVAKNRPAIVERGICGFSKITYAIPQLKPMVSCIILWDSNSFSDMKKCLKGILEMNQYERVEIILACCEDLNYKNEFFNDLKKMCNVKFLKFEGAQNEATLRNNAARNAEGEILAFLDNKIYMKIYTSNWLRDMVSYAIQHHVGAVGACLLHSDDTIYHAGYVQTCDRRVESLFYSLPYSCAIPFHLHRLSRYCTSLSLECLLIEKNKWKEVGGMNEALLTNREVELDFCGKLKKLGKDNVYVSTAVLYKNTEKRQIVSHNPKIMEKCDLSSFDARDSFYNPHLSLFPPALEIVRSDEPIREKISFRTNYNL